MDLEHLRQWIGREQTGEEILTPTLVGRFNATFDRVSGTGPGDVAPLLIHLCLTQPAVGSAELATDGHAARGEFLPPVPLPRRMWAGGAFQFHADIRIGETVTRKSTIANVVAKQGRSGRLCFVTVEHLIFSDGRAALTERQDIVYRDIPSHTEQTEAPDAALPGQHTRAIEPTAALLFRYSALTFNGHRIHYDRSYATQIEGYAGLLVHGPMQATLLCQMAADLEGRPPKSFNFRSLAPLFDDSPFTVNATAGQNHVSLWTSRLGGPVAMQAAAQW